jgi:hypothetical protein
VQEAARRAMPVERLHQEAEAKFNRIKVSHACRSQIRIKPGQWIRILEVQNGHKKRKEKYEEFLCKLL